MKEFLWLFPILAAIALVLGATRGETIGRIAKEAGRSFGKLTVGILVLAVALEIVLYAIPRVF